MDGRTEGRKRKERRGKERRGEERREKERRGEMEGLALRALYTPSN